MLCAYCSHGISAHQILGMIQDGRMISLVEAEPLPMQSTAHEERRELLKTKQRVPD